MTTKFLNIFPKKLRKMVPSICLLVVAGCASNPSEISAAYVDPEQFMQQNCSQLAQRDQNDTQALSEAARHQRRMHESDAWGVALIGVPVGSVGGDKHKEIGQLKGELDAIHTVERSKNCVGRFSAAEYNAANGMASSAPERP